MKTRSTYLCSKTILCLGTSLIAIVALAADYNQGSASQGGQINQGSPNTQQNPPNDQVSPGGSPSDNRHSSQNNTWSDTSNTGPMTSQQFVQGAAKGGMKEVQLSQLAIERSQNADVRRFARHLVRDHTSSNEKLADLAQKKGLSIPAKDSLAWSDTSDRTYVRTENTMNNQSSLNTSTSASTDKLGQGREATVLTDREKVADRTSQLDASTPASTDKATDKLGQGREATVLTDHENAASRNSQIASSQSSSSRAEGNWNAGRMDHAHIATLSGAEFDRAYVNAMVRDHAETIRKFELAAQNLDDADLKRFADRTLPTLREHYAMAQELSTKLGGTQGIERSQGTQGTQGTQGMQY
jgi:predicted outer membrane protein